MRKRIIILGVAFAGLIGVVGGISWFGRRWSPLVSTPVTQTDLNRAGVTISTPQSSSPIQIGGCATFIQPPQGEEMQPILRPGASLDQMRHVYGPESKKEEFDYLWNAKSFSIRYFENSKTHRAVTLDVESAAGSVVATPDGIELGKDTFSTLLEKLRSRGVVFEQRIASGDGPWILTVSFRSTCNPQLRSRYEFIISGGSKVEDPFGSGNVLKSNIFLPERAIHYSINQAQPGDEEVDGTQASDR